MKTSAKKRLAAIALVFALCASMLVTISFFTDREYQSTGGTAGNFDLTFTDISASKTGTNGITSPNESAIDKVWENQTLVSDGGVLNPGDYFDLSYTVANEGKKSMDVKQQLVLNSNVALTEGAEEYKLSFPNDSLAEILPECQPTYDEEEGFFPSANVAIIPAVGTTCVVNWNGTEYECVAQDLSAMAPGAILLGNGANMGLPATDEPFMVLIGEEGGTKVLLAYALDGTAELTLSIYQGAAEPSITGTLSADRKSITYDLPQLVLSGSVEKEGSKVEILPETTLTADPELPGEFGILENYPALVIGAKYTVKWNGTEYTGTAIDGTEGFGEGCVLLANDGTDVNTGEGLVFLIAYIPDQLLYFAEMTDATELTVAIHQGNIAPTEQTYTVRLDFNLMAENAFLGSNVTVNYKAQAKQHRNTNDTHWADWVDCETEYEKVFVTGLSLKSQPTNTIYEAGEAFDPTGMRVVFTDSNGFTRTVKNYTITDGDSLTAGQTSVTVSYTDAEDNAHEIVVPISVFNELIDFTITSSNRGDIGYDENAGAQNLVIPTVFEKAGTTYRVTSIDQEAFAQCTNLASVKIPNSVTSIGPAAFALSTLTSIEIPDSVTSIGQSAFGACPNLTNIKIPNSVTSINPGTFYGCTMLRSVEIPNSVTSIGEEAFYYCTNLKSIEIPDSVTTIGSNAFYNCPALASVTFGANSQLTAISLYSFSHCTSLTSIEIPASVTTIGERAFYGCTALESVTFGANSQLTAIEDSAFYGCANLTSVTFGANSQLTAIEDSAFADCTNLTSIEIPDSVTTIGNWAFDECEALTSVTFGENSQLTTIGKLAFYGCPALESVTFGANSQLTTIGERAFMNCESLESISIPAGVTTIESGAFMNCTDLTSVTFKGTPTSINISAFTYCPALKTINVPWAEGEVAGAPWEATSATIHYNYTGE